MKETMGCALVDEGGVHNRLLLIRKCCTANITRARGAEPQGRQFVLAVLHESVTSKPTYYLITHALIHCNY